MKHFSKCPLPATSMSECSFLLHLSVCRKWLRKHLVTAAVRTKAVQELREEVEKLKEDVTKQLQLREIIYDCGWNVEHFRGCLKSLEKLAELHPGAMDGLKDRTLVFAAFTGVSLEGHVMLFTGDVQRNWLEVR